MRERDGKSLVQLWNEAVYDRQDKTELSQTAKTYLLKMGTCFEYEGEQLQAEALGLFVTELDSEIDRLTAKKNENSRLIKALSTLTGILCIILFL
jgi:stage III sporulation protein AB